VNLNDFFAVVCTDFHEVVVSTRYAPFGWGMYLVQTITFVTIRANHGKKAI
jgi:hypothetical protein